MMGNCHVRFLGEGGGSDTAPLPDKGRSSIARAASSRRARAHRPEEHVVSSPNREAEAQVLQRLLSAPPVPTAPGITAEDEIYLRVWTIEQEHGKTDMDGCDVLSQHQLRHLRPLLSGTDHLTPTFDQPHIRARDLLVWGAALSPLPHLQSPVAAVPARSGATGAHQHRRVYALPRRSAGAVMAAHERW